MNSEAATTVTLTRDFVIQQYELTREAWAQFASLDPTSTDRDGGSICTEAGCPETAVTWFEAAAYANWLSDRALPPLTHCYELVGCQGEAGSGMGCQRAVLLSSSIYECAGFRMPSEPEWEYAARAGTTTAFYGGDIQPQPNDGSCRSEPALLDDAWYCFNSSGQAHPVGQKRPNALGLYDMEGNAMELVHSPYAHGYAQFPPVDPDPEGETISDRAIKGGNWNAWPSILRTADHLSTTWSARGGGVRFARTLEPGENW